MGFYVKKKLNLMVSVVALAALGSLVAGPALAETRFNAGFRCFLNGSGCSLDLKVQHMESEFDEKTKVLRSVDYIDGEYLGTDPLGNEFYAANSDLVSVGDVATTKEFEYAYGGEASVGIPLDLDNWTKPVFGLKGLYNKDDLNGGLGVNYDTASKEFGVPVSLEGHGLGIGSNVLHPISDVNLYLTAPVSVDDSESSEIKVMETSREALCLNGESVGYSPDFNGTGPVCF